MPATIQKILKPTKYRAVDTSGNNNHGQVYSGRALEFDGVSDYLNTGYIPYEGSAYGNITYAMWIKPEAASPGDNQLYFDDRVASSRGFHGYIRSSTGILEFRNTDTGDNANLLAIDTTGAELTNSWVRLCLVYDASAGSYGTIYAYANGQLKGSTALTAAFTSVGANNLRIGANTNNIKFFEGKMSDFQVWNTAFTASDALYDYLNPESLALSNSGTSLTESNLKLWYPMQDGYRGNDGVNDGKHFIMDGANTGLGDEILSEGDFSSSYTPAYGGSTNWTNSVDGNTAWTIANGVATRDGSAVNSGIDQANVFENGKFYRVSYSISNRTQGSLTLYRGQGTQLISNDNSNGDFVYYFTSGGASKLLVNGVSNFDGSVDNISVKEVLNTQKNHATAVFYGDELITSDYEDNGTFTNDNGNWAVYDPESTSAITINTWDATYGNGGDNGGLKFTISGTSTEIQGVQLGTGYFDTLVAGRTYRVSIDMKAGHPSNTDAWAIGLGGGVSANFNITQSYATYTKDIVATSDAALLVYNINDGNNRPAYIDNVSIKEVGTASGWTDADQQLDIPQTALQSYNQLAWFPGTDSGTDFDINCGSDSTIDDIFNGGGTVSAWIYPTGSSTPQNMIILHKGHGTAPDSGWYVGIQNLSSGNYVVRLDTSFDGANNGRWDSDNRVIKQGAWNHIAVNWNDDSLDNNPTIFVNGESVAITENETPSGGSSYNTDASREFLIGNSHGGTRPFGGAITEVSLWDTGLSTAQVGELYNDGKALDALTHSLASSNLKAYWRNNGVATWKDLKNSNDGTVNNVSETILIPAGVDASRDTQGFIMNRQRTTSSFNNNTIISGDVDYGSYSKVKTHPLYTGSAVTNYSISLWMKIGIKPSDFLTSGNTFNLFDTTISNASRAFKAVINHNNIIYLYTYYGGSAGDKSVYVDYDLDSLGGSIVNPPTATSNGIGEAFDPNKWYHVTWTFDHDRTTGSGSSDNTNAEDHNFTPYFVYINGIQVASEGREGANSAMTTARSMQDANVPMIIGSDMSTGGDITETNYVEFPGEMDDICFYSDTLTSGEVLRNYNAGKRSHR